ncbi:MAG: PepSY domain-containing protein [Flammeovirgaceae bacterium]|nr:PepSY domain-containing protein [Flammeovirgaceae bacterium]
MANTKKLAKTTPFYRKLHRYVGSVLFVFFFIISITGLLLGWKKHSGGLILPKTETGISTDMKNLLSYDSQHSIAIQALKDSLPEKTSATIDRIDARPGKGMVKFVFQDHYTEIQLDATTGAVLDIHQRTSDIIEQIHDGSILDFAFSTSNGQIKLSYITVVGTSLLLLTITGFFLWYNPLRLRKQKGSRRLNKKSLLDIHPFLAEDYLYAFNKPSL